MKKSTNKNPIIPPTKLSQQFWGERRVSDKCIQTMQNFKKLCNAREFGDWEFSQLSQINCWSFGTGVSEVTSRLASVMERDEPEDDGKFYLIGRFKEFKHRFMTYEPEWHYGKEEIVSLNFIDGKYYAITQYGGSTKYFNLDIETCANSYIEVLNWTRLDAGFEIGGQQVISAFEDSPEYKAFQAKKKKKIEKEIKELDKKINDRDKKLKALDKNIDKKIKLHGV